MSHSPNSRPRSRSIHGKAFSCPMARMTSSQGMTTVSITVEWRACSSHSRRWNSMPVSRPSSMTKRVGAWLTRISTPSSSASSSSHDEALKNERGRRAITLMSVPPRRSEERQQSMAVLPTPMISTRSPTLSVWPNAIDSSQSMPMWIRSLSWRPGMSRSLPRGAPVPMNTASKSCASRERRLDTGVSRRRSTPMSTMVAISSSMTSAGAGTPGYWCA